MFDRGNQHFIAAAHVPATPALHDEVDTFRGPARENDFFLGARVDETFHRRPRLFVGGGGDFAQIVHATMHVRVLFRVVTNEAVDDGLRLLRRGRVVEIDERVAAYRTRENREILTDSRDVVNRGPRTEDRGRQAHDLASALRSGNRPGMCSNIARRTCSRIGSTFMRSTISLANAYTRRLRASSSAIPRERR